MPDFRLVASTLPNVGDIIFFTHQKDDRTSEGAWSRPNTPVLIFADNVIDGASFTFHGGPVAGAPGGHPLQLVFWGDWWLGPGMETRLQLEAWTRAMIESPYFSQLSQYGIPHAPVWRGSTIVTKPAPPMAEPDMKSIGAKVMDLIDDLIDDDVFPDPDDGPRILFVVVLPDGFVLGSGNVAGAHRSDYDYDFPFDTDRFWAGWVKPNADREKMMRVISHEVVEMMTDPEGDAWHTEKNTSTNEVSDPGFSGGTPTNPGVAQTAYVNGARVQSYWSNAHGATIIPIDTDYGARLSAHIRELGRRTLARDTFRIDESDRIGCPAIKECCIDDRDYAWRLDGLDERARVTLHCVRFAQPVVKWTINGTALTSSPITLSLNVEQFSGRSATNLPTAAVTNRPVTLRFSSPPDRPDVLDVFADNPGGNFEIVIGCTVTDGSITGNVATNVVATPTVTVGFACAEVLLEEAYLEQKSACLTAMVGRYVHNYKPLGRIRPEEGINWNPTELLRDRPAYYLPSHYRQLRWLAKTGRAARALLGPAEASRFVQSLTLHAPVLARNVRRQGVRLSQIRQESDVATPSAGRREMWIVAAAAAVLGLIALVAMVGLLGR